LFATVLSADATGDSIVHDHDKLITIPFIDLDLQPQRKSNHSQLKTADCSSVFDLLNGDKVFDECVLLDTAFDASLTQFYQVLVINKSLVQ